MRYLLSGAILALFIGGSALATTSPARAAGTGLEFCNQSSAATFVAAGYHSPGVNDPADHSLLTGPFVSIGWSTVGAGECHTFANPFNARYMFWFAANRSINDAAILPSLDPNAFNTTNGLWSTNSDVFFCATSYFDNPTHRVGEAPSFTYEDENESEAACHRGAYNLWLPVRKVDTWVNATVNFTGT